MKVEEYCDKDLGSIMDGAKLSTLKPNLSGKKGLGQRPKSSVKAFSG